MHCYVIEVYCERSNSTLMITSIAINWLFYSKRVFSVIRRDRGIAIKIALRSSGTVPFFDLPMILAPMDELGYSNRFQSWRCSLPLAPSGNISTSGSICTSMLSHSMLSWKTGCTLSSWGVPFNVVLKQGFHLDHEPIPCYVPETGSPSNPWTIPFHAVLKKQGAPRVHKVLHSMLSWNRKSV